MKKSNKQQAILAVLTLILTLGLVGCGKGPVANTNQNQDVNTNLNQSSDVNQNNNTNQNTNISQDQNIKLEECNNGQGFIVDQYKAKNELREIDFDINKLNQQDYKLFEDNLISFYYPSDWQGKIESSPQEDKKEYFIYPFEHLRITLSIQEKDNFIEDYQGCLSRCFDKSSIIGVNFSWDAFYCSENYNQDNLNKILLGKYINYLETGSLPPGGAGIYIFSRVIEKKLIEISFSSEDILEISSKIRQGKIWDDFNEEEKNIAKEEINIFMEQTENLIESIELK